ncbi:MAG: flagellar biosynthesis protein FlhA [Pseudomonadota bacterium]
MAVTTQPLRTGSRMRDLLGVAARQNDLVLAGLLVAIVALFVLPLPTPLLDLLIATNLAISLVLLIVAMYVPSALSLSTFPSLLLFTTLFRLALNIASTKLILLHAHAGHIIDTFGKLIVGNNVVVGGVVFLIIAIVQFIVIAKGSERVAEVAARFALDAMPGKQMSIDADVRAGVLSSSEAQRRRQQLEQECTLHGAMDGAMKFVKGDAIASIIIALVNILAGITIGTLMLDMSVGGALQRYAILTVGDGMVSQIPSLLVSVAAGIVITRVSTDDTRESHTQLASQMGRQLLAHPRALLVAGLAVASFLAVPGFPKWAFALLAVLILGLGLATRRLRRLRRMPAWIAHEEEAAEAQAEAQQIAAPLALHLAANLRGRLDRHALARRLGQVKAAVDNDLGPVFPRMQIQHDPGLPDDAYSLLVQDVPVAQGLVDLQAEAPEEALAAHVEQVTRRHAAQMIGLQQVQWLLRLLQRDAPELAAETARVVPPQRMAEVLRRLLQEGIPLRNLSAICESLVQRTPHETDNIALTEMVRIDLGRFITSRHAGARRELQAILFESSLLERIQNAIERSPRGNMLLLSPAVKQEIREQVRRIADPAAPQVVAITSADVRRYVKTLIDPVAPHLTVLSYQEIDEDVTLQPVGWITNPKTA